MTATPSFKVRSQPGFPLCPAPQGWQLLEGSSGSFPPKGVVQWGIPPRVKHCQEITTGQHRELEKCKNVELFGVHL